VEAPLTLTQLEGLGAKRKLGSKEYERRESLTQIRDGLQALEEENPQLKTDQFYKQVEGLAPSMVEPLSNSIFDIFALSGKGVSKFNQLVEGNKAWELSSLICSGVSLLDRCYRSYHAGKDVLSALEKNLQDLNPAPMPLLIQAKPKVVRVLLSVDGKSFTWDCPGTLTGKGVPLPSVPKVSFIAEAPEEEEEDTLEGMELHQEHDEDEDLEPQALTLNTSGLFEGAEDDTPAQRADRWREFVRQRAVDEDTVAKIKSRLLDDKAGVLNDEEKAAVDGMGFEDIVSYTTGPYMDKLVEKNPEYLMDIDG
jgi:hypothetical protein